MAFSGEIPDSVAARRQVVPILLPHGDRFAILSLVALSLPFDDLCVPLGSWNKRVLTEVCRVFQLPESSIPAVQPLCRISPGWPPPVQGGEGGDGGEEAERDASSSAAAALWPAHDVSEEERRAQNLGVFSELLQASTPSVRYEMLRVLLSTLVVRVGGYDARARGMMQQLATAIDVQWSGEEGLSVAEDSLARVLLAPRGGLLGSARRGRGFVRGGCRRAGGNPWRRGRGAPMTSPSHTTRRLSSIFLVFPLCSRKISFNEPASF